MPNTTSNKRNPIFFGVFFLVIMLMVYYIFAYIPKKENDLQNRGIRVVNRMTNNIAEKESHYEKSIAGFKCKYLVSHFIEQNYSIEEISGKLDEVCLKRFNETLSAITLKGADKIKYLKSQINVNVDAKVTFAKNTDNLVLSKTITEKNTDYIFGLEAQAFLTDIKHYSFFDDIILTEKGQKSGQVLDYSLESINIFNYSKGKLIGKNIYDEKGNIKEQASIDTTTPISGVALTEQEISNTNYYCYTSEIFIDGNPYYITGLISKKNFNSQVRSVSIWIVVITIVFLVFLIQILPIVKPFLMSKKDRLNSSDVMWSGVSLIFGLSALILLTLGIDTFILDEQNLVDDKLERYNTQLLSEFKSERECAYEILLDFSQGKLENRDSDAITRAVNFIRSEKNNFSIIEIDYDGKIKKYSRFYSDSTLIEINSKPDISHRNYVTIHTTKDSVKAWSAPNVGNIKLPTFVESIFSLSTGKYETVMSVKDTNGKIYALVYPFKSINNVYLEPNYQFAITNRRGNIQYHSEQSKIHNENIVDESNNDENLKAFLQNGSSTHLDLNIALKDYTAYLQPIGHTAFYMLTMYDIKKSRLTISTSMATTFQFILALIAYLLFFHVVLRLQRFLSKQHDSKAVTYYFLNPSATPIRTYYLLLFINFITIIYLFFLYRTFYLGILDSTVVLFLLITVLSLLNYHELTRVNQNSHSLTYPLFKLPFTLFEIVLVVLAFLWIAVYVFILSSHSGKLVLPILLLVFVFYRKWKHRSPMLINRQKVKPKTYKPFYYHTFTWIFLLSVFPTLMFFKPIYNRQHIKRVTHHLQEEYFTRVKTQNWDDHKINKFDTLTIDSVINDDGDSRIVLDALNLSFDKEEKKLKGLYKSKNLKAQIGVNNASTHNPTFFRVSIEPYGKYFSSKTISANDIKAFSLPNPFIDSNKIESLFFWVVLTLALLAMFQTIVHLSEKFFQLRLSRQLLSISPLERSLKLFANNKSETVVTTVDLDKAEKNLMLIGLPYSGRNAILKQHLKNEYQNAIHLDFINDLKQLKNYLEGVNDNPKKGLNRTIIINNYDYRILDFKDNLDKLKLLEYILGQKTITNRREYFILIGSLDIYQIIDIYQDDIRSLRAQGTKESLALIEERNNTIDRWESALFGFSKHIVPLIPTVDNDVEPHRVEYFINSELDFGISLQKLKPHIELYAKELLCYNEDRYSVEGKIINEIQSMAENYYFSIWNSCSKEEKFLLFDLAQDGLINAANSKNIENLVRKGIITINPKLQVFNLSFAQFIVETISEDESRQMEIEAKKGGTWNSYRYLVIFLVIIIVIFLSFVEEQAFTQLTGIVSLGAALLPRLLSLITSFTTKRKGLV